MSKRQRDLFVPDRDPEDTYIKPELYFDRDCIPAVEALFQNEVSNPRTRATATCPYRAGDQFLSRSLLFTCECPQAHALVKSLGVHIPRCSKHRCPVRIVMSLYPE